MADSKGITLGVDIDNNNNIITDGQTIANNFNMIIVGYFSWGWIRRRGPDVSTIDFKLADQWVNFALSKGMKVTNGNALVYHHDLPEWLTKGQFTREQLISILQQHTSTVVGRYKGQVSEWVVSNEAFVLYQGQRLYQHYVFYDGIGPEYVDIAFQAARQADPNAILIYNDYGIEVPGPKADWIFENVKRLNEKGLVDAVGFQMHISRPPNLDAANPPSKDDIVSQIKRYKEIGVDVIVTELDVDASRLPGPKEEQLARQAEIYKTVVEASLKGGCKSISVWGLNDPGPYLPADASPLLFSNNKPKPAYYAIRDILASKP